MYKPIMIIALLFLALTAATQEPTFLVDVTRDGVTISGFDPAGLALDYGYYVIQDNKTLRIEGAVREVEADNPADGSRVYTATLRQPLYPGTYQVWALVYTENGYIEAVNSQEYIAVHGAFIPLLMVGDDRR